MIRDALARAGPPLLPADASFELANNLVIALDVKDGLLIGKQPGVVAVAVATEDDVVLDFIHLTVLRADRVDVHGFDGAGADLGQLSEAVELTVGESAQLVPRAYAGSERLAG